VRWVQDVLGDLQETEARVRDHGVLIGEELDDEDEVGGRWNHSKAQPDQVRATVVRTKAST